MGICLNTIRELVSKKLSFGMQMKLVWLHVDCVTVLAVLGIQAYVIIPDNIDQKAILFFYTSNTNYMGGRDRRIT